LIALVVVFNILDVSSQEDASPLASGFWLDDEDLISVALVIVGVGPVQELLHRTLISILLHVGFKSSEVTRKYPGSRIELEFFAVLGLHRVEQLAELIFSTNDAHPWKMIDSLIALELGKPVHVLLPRPIHPIDVKVVVVWIPSKPICHIRGASTRLLV